MKDFTLYLRKIDPLSFSPKDSRYGNSNFKDEWDSAWGDYLNHLDSFKCVAKRSLMEYASANWRSNPEKDLCVKYRNVCEVIFNAIGSSCLIKIYNEIVSRYLVISYSGVSSFNWVGDVSFGEASGEDMFFEDDFDDVVFYMDEIRFNSKYSIEHEIIFLNGARLLVVAGDVDVNIEVYCDK